MWSKDQRGNAMKKIEKILRECGVPLNAPKCVLEIPEEEERKEQEKNGWKNIAEDFTSLLKDVNLHIQEVQ